MTGGSGHPAGWYDDGVTPGVQRWFDGVGWSETTRPLAPPPVVAMPAAVNPYGQDAAYGQPVGFGSVAPAMSTFGAGFTSARQAAAPYGTGFAAPLQSGAPYGTVLPVGRLVDEAAVRSARRTMTWALLGGMFALVVGGVIAILRARAMELGVSSSGGHYIATGGLISGTVAFVRAGKSYRSMVDQGGTPWSTPAKAFVIGSAGLAALLGVVGVVQVARASSLPPLGPAVAGSCWTGGTTGDVLQVLQVRCSTAHEYIGTLVTLDSAGTDCPAQTDSVLNLADGTGFYLCLALDSSLA
ncbi:DUF2510 domain-containing protein [Cellulomonas humilata]|uniref:DUF2510 domain-containing protein n=1 Tax=Cellulomonas humilata TaxID=144055 RepID=A0A7Y6A2B9_9CELL|nr:DUF2510 domain-containing protein [Cellulomonas humilata]